MAAVAPGGPSTENLPTSPIRESQLESIRSPASARLGANSLEPREGGRPDQLQTPGGLHGKICY